MDNIENKGIGSFEVNLTTKTQMPSIEHINELAADRNISFDVKTFVKAPALLEDLYYMYRKERELCDEFKVKDFLFSEQQVEKNLGREMNSSEKAYYQSTLKFLSELNYAACPGRSPMDKALNTIMYLVKLTEEKKTNSSGDSIYNDTPRTSIITPESLMGSIKDSEKGFNGDGDDGDKNREGQEMSKDVISCVREHLYDLSPSIANVLGEELLIDIPVNNDLLKLIDIKAYLEEKVDLSTSKDKKLIQNNSSNQKKQYQIDSYSKINKVSAMQRVMPNFDDKFVKKELAVKEKVKPEEKKQMLTILLDDSGSMNCAHKQAYVRALLMNRLQSVVEGKSKVRFFSFESTRYNPHEASTKEEAAKLYKHIVRRRPSGGGTNVGACLQQTIDEIHNLPGYHKPEILIINDGDKRIFNINIHQFV